MGTNYYWHPESACPTCGHRDEESALHIGKSSGGWCFSLHVARLNDAAYDAGLPLNLDGWREKFSQPGSEIVDEYGCRIHPDDMLTTITERSWPLQDVLGRTRDPLWYAQNSAQEGPNGLVRHLVDGYHCIGHGEGTWDLVAGEFS
jgi:hypothetical protein